MHVSIRPLSTNDIEQVVDLSLRAWAPVLDSMATALGAEIFECLYGSDMGLPDQERAVRRACSEHLVWVAAQGERIVGFTAVDLREDSVEGEIAMIAVDPEYQGRGIGRELTAFAVDQIKAAGKKLAVVATGGDPGHAPARATYEKAGFTGYPTARYYKIL